MTVVFGEDFKFTSGDVVFSKGDIVRIPALYLWHLYDIDAKQTAQLLKANAVKFVINGAALISMGVAEGATSKLFATLDFASIAYTTIVSPAIKKENLSKEALQIVDAFESLAQLYMVYRCGDGALTLGKSLYNYAQLYRARILAAKAAAKAGTYESRILMELDQMAAVSEEVAAAYISQLESFLKKYNLKGSAIETMLNSAPGGNKASLVMQLMSWESKSGLYALLESALKEFQGLAVEVANEPTLLGLFNKIRTEFGPALLARKWVIEGKFSGKYAEMVNKTPAYNYTVTGRLGAIEKMEDLKNSFDIGNFFDTEMERFVLEYWNMGANEMLSAEVKATLNQLKAESYDLVIKPKLTIYGKRPEPDLFFIKNEGGQLNYNDCIYIDNKYSIKFNEDGSVIAPFTGGQTQIVNE